MKKLLAVTLLAIGGLSAQEPTLPVIRPQWNEIQQYLALSTAQLATLEQVFNARQQAEQAIYRQMAEKQQQLNALLEQGSNDVTSIGRLTVDINNLRRQLPLNKEPYRSQALAALNDAQKAKLPTLAEALTLQTPAWQATSLNLIDSPNPPARILPVPLPALDTETSVLRSAR